MPKLSKLRISPAQFFADSKYLPVRFLGRLVTPRIEASATVMALLEDPVEALEEGDFALLRALVGRYRRHASARRRALLEKANTPKVSVVMPARNASSSIARAIESVRTQSYSRLELIVVDDGSSDDTAAIVSEVAARDARVHLLRNANCGGAGRARNVGLARTTGDYITFQDADDRSHPERIERQLAALIERPGAVVCLCNFGREDAAGGRLSVNGRRFGRAVISMLFPRRPVFTQIGFMLEYAVGEDTEYFERIRAVFGKDREVHLFQTLYRAGFSPGSLLFANGETEVTLNGQVSYSPSSNVAAHRDRIRRRIAAIQRGELDPFVEFVSET